MFLNVEKVLEKSVKSTLNITAFPRGTEFLLKRTICLIKWKMRLIWDH